MNQSFSAAYLKSDERLWQKQAKPQMALMIASIRRKAIDQGREVVVLKIWGDLPFRRLRYQLVDLSLGQFDRRFPARNASASRGDFVVARSNLLKEETAQERLKKF